MKIISALEEYKKSSNEIACFLAGGCTSLEWRTKVYEELDKTTLNSLVIFDPYNSNITDPEKQIEWEFNYLNKYKNDFFIFSVYFDKYTDQPISMYELGRASVLCKEQAVKVGPWNDPFMNNTQCFHLAWGFPMVVSVHPEAPKRKDIFTQCKLADIMALERTPEQHAQAIRHQYNIIRSRLK